MKKKAESINWAEREVKRGWVDDRIIDFIDRSCWGKVDHYYLNMLSLPAASWEMEKKILKELCNKKNCKFVFDGLEKNKKVHEKMMAEACLTRPAYDILTNGHFKPLEAQSIDEFNGKVQGQDYAIDRDSRYKVIFFDMMSPWTKKTANTMSSTLANCTRYSMATTDFVFGFNVMLCRESEGSMYYGLKGLPENTKIKCIDSYVRLVASNWWLHQIESDIFTYQSDGSKAPMGVFLYHFIKKKPKG